MFTLYVFLCIYTDVELYLAAEEAAIASLDSTAAENEEPDLELAQAIAPELQAPPASSSSYSSLPHEVETVQVLAGLADHFSASATAGMENLAESLHVIIENKQSTDHYTSTTSNTTGKDAAKRKRGVPQLSSTMMNFNNLSQIIGKSCITNHQRLKYNDELLHAAICLSIEKIGAETIFGKNALTRMVGALFMDQLPVNYTWQYSPSTT